MCEPISLITAGLSVASAVSGVVAQKKQQKAVDQHNDAQFAADTENASAQAAHNVQQTANIKDATIDSYDQNSVSRQQTQEQAGQKIQTNEIDAAKAAATARTSAGENGFSVSGILNQIEADKLRYNDSVNSNLQDQLEGFDQNDKNIYKSGKNQVNQLQDPGNVVRGVTPAAPDYLGAALKIGGAGYGAYQGGAFDPAINYLKGSSGRVDNTLF